jgi:hypothetical protein
MMMISEEFSKTLRRVVQVIGACFVFFSAAAWLGETFEPPDGKVLVFIGQDNESVGGTENHRRGYADRVGAPAGITHYKLKVPVLLSENSNTAVPPSSRDTKSGSNSP